MAYSSNKNCKWCGTTYDKYSAIGDFCSKKCQHEYQINSPKPMSFGWLKLLGIIVLGALVYFQNKDSTTVTNDFHDNETNVQLNPQEAEEFCEEHEPVEDLRLHTENESHKNFLQRENNDEETITVGDLMASETQIAEESLESIEENSDVQSGLDIQYNQLFNSELYLLRQCWYYFEKNECSKLSIITNAKKSIKFKKRKVNRNYYFERLMELYLQIEEPIKKIIIDEVTFKASDCDLKYDLNPNVFLCAKDHVEFVRTQKKTGHEQGIITYEDRLIKYSITGAGIMGENVSKVVKQAKELKSMRRTSHAYFKGRFTSAHWDSWMDSEFRFYTTAHASDQVYSYTVTLMSEELSDR